MHLNLIQAPIDMSNFHIWTKDRGWSDGGTFDEGLALHHLTVEMFGPGVFRPFRLLVGPRSARGNLYGYSALSAQELRAAADVQAMPDQMSVLDPARLLSKSMPAIFAPGKKVGFDLFVRPVRRVRAALGDSFKGGNEVDAFVHEALRKHAADPTGMGDDARSRESVYLDWLAERLAPAAELDRAASRLHAFRRRRVVRNRLTLEGPDATIHGTCTITDPQAFEDMLRTGVGRHCAYGYGMLLLRAPQAPVPER